MTLLQPLDLIIATSVLNGLKQWAIRSSVLLSCNACRSSVSKVVDKSIGRKLFGI
jgi:hypothetical protein